MRYRFYSEDNLTKLSKEDLIKELMYLYETYLQDGEE